MCIIFPYLPTFTSKYVILYNLQIQYHSMQQVQITMYSKIGRFWSIARPKAMSSHIWLFSSLLPILNDYTNSVSFSSNWPTFTVGLRQESYHHQCPCDRPQFMFAICLALKRRQVLPWRNGQFLVVIHGWIWENVNLMPPLCINFSMEDDHGSWMSFGPKFQTWAHWDSTIIKLIVISSNCNGGNFLVPAWTIPQFGNKTVPHLGECVKKMTSTDWAQISRMCSEERMKSTAALLC